MPASPRKGLPPIAIIGIVAGALVLALCIGAVIMAGLLGARKPTRTTADVGMVQPTTTSQDAVVAAATTGNTTAPGATSAATTKAATLVIPDGLIGANALIAHDRLVALGFTNVYYASADPEDTIVIVPQNWHVTKVEPTPGSTVARTATIVLTCSKK